MKAVILAAGKGTRLRPLTNDVPKPLVQINGAPFLAYLIERLSDAGCDELALVVGYKRELIADFCAERGIDAELIIQEHQLGTGHAVRLCEDFVDNERFLVVMGDNLYDSRDIGTLAAAEGAYVAGLHHDHPERFGVLIERDGALVEIREKPTTFVGNLINTGLYALTPDVFSCLRHITKSPTGEFYLTDAVTMLARKQTVAVHRLQHYW